MSSLDLYPDKPEISTKEENNNWSITIGSLLLFIVTFLLLFKEHFQFVFLLIVVLFVHELGHYICMKAFKYKNVKMLFVPLMGAFVQGEKTNYSQKQSLLVVMAGPFPGIIIGTVLLIIAYFNNITELYQIGVLFYLLNVFNLLPIDPLDGGQLVRYLFIAKSEKMLFVFSFLSSLFMIAIGFWLESYLLMGFGFLMGIRVRSIQKKIALYADLDVQGIEYSKSYEDLSNKEYHLLRRYSIENSSILSKYYRISDEIDESFVATYVKSILRIPIQMDMSLGAKIILFFSWLLVLIIIPSMIILSIKFKWIGMDSVGSLLQFT